MALFFSDDSKGIEPGCYELNLDPISTKAFFSIGRDTKDLSPKNDINLSCGSVSRRHARLMMDRGLWHIQDCNSGCGTWVNGKKLKPWDYTPLETSSKILFGPSVKALWLPSCESTAPGDAFEKGWPQLEKVDVSDKPETAATPSTIGVSLRQLDNQWEFMSWFVEHLTTSYGKLGLLLLLFAVGLLAVFVLA